MAERFDGKVVIVTGAGSGIGEAAARRFAAEGARVVLTDSVKDKIDAVVASLPEERAMAVPADSSDYDQVAVMVQETIKRFGRLDVLVNNAARSRRARSRTPASTSGTASSRPIYPVCSTGPRQPLGICWRARGAS